MSKTCFFTHPQKKKSIGVILAKPGGHEISQYWETTLLEKFCSEILAPLDSSVEKCHLTDRKCLVKNKPFVGLHMTEAYTGTLNCNFLLKEELFCGEKGRTTHTNWGYCICTHKSHMEPQNPNFCIDVCLWNLTSKRLTHHWKNSKEPIFAVNPPQHIHSKLIPRWRIVWLQCLHYLYFVCRRL